MKKTFALIIALFSITASNSFANCVIEANGDLPSNAKKLIAAAREKNYSSITTGDSSSGDLSVTADVGGNDSLISFHKMMVTMKYLDHNKNKITKSKEVICMEHRMIFDEVIFNEEETVSIKACRNKAARIAARMLPDASEIYCTH